jgi:hypothetical protein
MITPEDVQRMVSAHQQVRSALEQKEPRHAAEILCKELSWLSEANGSFFEGLRAATETAEEHRTGAKKVLENLAQFIDEEGAIFSRLKVDPAQYGPVLGNVYSALILVQEADLSPKSMAALQKVLGEAASLVCKHSQGPIGRAVDWVMSWKGTRILGGAAVTGANAAALVAPAFIPFLPAHIHICFGSMIVGTSAMKGDAKGLIDLLKPK